MPIYQAPLDDIRFVLHELLDIGRLSTLPGHAEATPELIDAVLEQGARFAENELFPLNQTADAEGCTYENGVVRTPPGFREAYARYAADGWIGLSADPAHGGQGLPHLVHFVMEEVINAAGIAFANYPLLTTAAYNCVARFGDDELKSLFLPKLANGEWAGTMCLSEAGSGTDLGLVRTRAEPAGDGSYRLSGTKIFISAGEHDLTPNIVHMVLARLPGAPAGTRGISLFLVPKFLPRADDGRVVPGMRNGIACTRIEDKMGLNGSATCELVLDGATGWLVGGPHRGMRAMFVMMNAARLGVGLQGLGIAEVAYQNARAYARERLQGRAVTGARAPDRPADPIIVHPDVRRMLLTMKAFTEGARALAYWVGCSIDVMERHPDPALRREAEDLVALMTPVVKAYFTDMGTDCANLGLQVYGGHGYIRANGMEQHVRDVRIAQIYEGANGIQALDLVGRKLGQNTGRLLRRFFHPVDDFLRAHGTDPALADFVPPLAKAFAKLQQVTAQLARQGLNDPEEAAAAATEYLRLFALVALGYMWARMAALAAARAPGADGRAGFYAAKLHTARFFMARMLPETTALAAAILSGKNPIMGLAEEAF